MAFVLPEFGICHKNVLLIDKTQLACYQDRFWSMVLVEITETRLQSITANSYLWSLWANHKEKLSGIEC